MTQLGVYVHFPWCLKKCGYCDFVSLAARREQIPHEAYADAVIAEWAVRSARLVGKDTTELASIYVGGGTPSLWDAQPLGKVLDALQAGFRRRRDPVEITVECNPSSFDRPHAEALRRAGVNRVSLGIQSLDPSRLAFLERLHDVHSALSALRVALEVGFTRVSGDLMFGVAGQTPDDAAREARVLSELGVTHLSTYGLTIERGTAFGRRAALGRLPVLPEEAVAESYLAVHESLLSQGFSHYEISSFARGGHFAVHNLGYWRGQDYVGLGCGACGTVTSETGRIRYQNETSPARYLSRPENPEATMETIDAETALRERILLGLRLASGLDLALAASELGVDPWSRRRRRAMERLIAKGQLEQAGEVLRIPQRWWLFADGIIASLL